MFGKKYGKRCAGLLAILCWMFAAPFYAGGQTARVYPESELLPRGPSPGQVPRLPSSGISTFPGTFGLRELTHAAGTIFAGTVTKIARDPSAGGAVETVAVTFHVDRAIRGASPGESLTIFQWAGLWTSGQRYHVGERVLLFLYPPSKLGLTSCVGGNLGRFAVDPSGWIKLTDRHLTAFRADPFLSGISRVRFRDFAQAVLRNRSER